MMLTQLNTSTTKKLFSMIGTKSLTALAILGLATSLSACGDSEHHEVTAPEKVEEAAQLAIANAPKAEVIEFEKTPMPATTTDGTAATDPATPAMTTDSNATDMPTDATAESVEGAQDAAAVTTTESVTSQSATADMAASQEADTSATATE